MKKWGDITAKKQENLAQISQISILINKADHANLMTQKKVGGKWISVVNVKREKISFASKPDEEKSAVKEKLEKFDSAAVYN